MIKKTNIFKLLILAVLPVFLSSCNREEEIFDQDANIRIDQKLEQIRNVLSSSKAGWMFKMYPSADLKFGGFNIFMQFDADGNMRASNELFEDPSRLIESHYSLTSIDGPTLSFDTFNTSVHMFSEPASRIFTESRPKGADGDFIFKVISVSDNKIVLKGIRNERIIEMEVLKEGQNGIEVLKKIQEMDRNLSLVKFALKYDNNSSIGFTSSRFGRILSLKNGDNIPFLYTDKGIELFTEYRFGDATAKSFTLEEVDGKKVLKSESNKVEIERLDPTLAERIILGNWYTADALIPRYNALFGSIDQSLKRAIPNASLQTMRLASSSNSSEGNGFGLWGQLSTGRSAEPLEFYIPLQYEIDDKAPNEITFSYPAKEKAGTISYALSNRLLFKFLVYPFANIGSIPEVNWKGNLNPRTFTIVDSPELAERFKVPSVITLTEKRDRQNSIILILNTPISAYQPRNNP